MTELLHMPDVSIAPVMTGQAYMHHCLSRAAHHMGIMSGMQHTIPCHTTCFSSSMMKG